MWKRMLPEPDMAEPHILIAGAGIGGLAAALCLAKAGWRVTICDRQPALREFGAGVQLSPNATRILAALDVMQPLTAYAVETEAIVIREAQRGTILSEARLGATALKRYKAPFLAVHRGDLQKALLQAVAVQPAITLRLGLRLTDAREGDEGITGLFENDEGTTTEIKADVLVGADGLWSRARGLAGLDAPSRYSGNTAWRSLIAREQAPLFAREAKVNLWLGKRAHLVHYPVCGGEQINIVATIEDPWREEGWSAPGNPDVLMAEFAGWAEPVLAMLQAAKGWQRWALMDRAPERHWSKGRITVMGDAAHPMVPFLAQGASQAIGDAAALAHALRNPASALRAPERALKAYETARLGHTARVQAMARQQAEIYHMNGVMAQARDAALRLLPGRAMLTRFSWIYDDGAEKTGLS
jgi:salicylate hydroxylase